MSDNAFLPCVLRVGSGLLQGCEFRLCNSRTLFIVGTTDLLGDDGLASAVPDEAIFVPLEQRGCNFEVLLGPQGVSLRILGEEIEERAVVFQRSERIGELVIALRPEGEPWVPGLFNAQTPAEPMKSTRNRRPMLKRMVVTVLLFILLAVCAAVSSLPMDNSWTDIAALVAGTRGATHVLQGRDGRIYVFVTSQYDAGWSRQVLMRQRISSSVLDVLEEGRRLEGLLAERIPALKVRRIDLSQPSSVRVLHGTAQGPLDAELRQQVSRLLLGEAAYLRQVDFEELDERLPDTLAAQGLEQLGLTFERIEQGDGTLFTIAGDLRDAEREEARRFVDEFYRRWGRRHVRFNIELRDDPFKGRSFQLGPEGYIKTSQSSWHFPTTQQVR
ncbi:type III secretion system protein PrgH/EprH [Pseudomonas asplenii]|uniref:Type III secretion system protein PrgH/EprH n=1 Tax=Pseudomonas asplenii TaxID=53407 RepID=A0A1H6NGT3_9PSED|nr:PrgH/EprH family type III secretion apparatus protein [Pseudomonas fuscovaginae]SEI14542.1 type III secretion system protein PrgH/EprH [Pseudomonas fuscovaginae]